MSHQLSQTVGHLRVIPSTRVMAHVGVEILAFTLAKMYKYFTQEQNSASTSTEGCEKEPNRQMKWLRP